MDMLKTRWLLLLILAFVGMASAPFLSCIPRHKKQQRTSEEPHTNKIQGMILQIELPIKQSSANRKPPKRGAAV